MLTDLITSTDPATRDKALAEACAALDPAALLEECQKLDDFRRTAENLYDRVRALFFLSAIHRYHLPEKLENSESGSIPFPAYEDLLARRFEEAIDLFLTAQKSEGASDALCSALAAAYHQLAFQTLADQVRKSVRTVRGNQWMFRMGHPVDHPLRIRQELLSHSQNLFPVLRERTPVRMDLTHSAWSDIFFLGMDFPEGARVINVSIDLAVHGRDDSPQPPVEAYFRVIDKPVLRLTSIDLKASAEISSLSEVFDFAKDYLGLLKAAVIASGIIPPGIEGSGESLADLLGAIAGPGRGIEIISSVNNIPKGSRLAVSTNLLAALIAACMRATGQTQSLTGELTEDERRLVLARAILGEWIGGSG
ncbi:MAG: UTP--glucose-1-phosphate uridylyltransferase, partial [Akkermansiaceae bacterium]